MVECKHACMHVMFRSGDFPIFPCYVSTSQGHVASHLCTPASASLSISLYPLWLASTSLLSDPRTPPRPFPSSELLAGSYPRLPLGLILNVTLSESDSPCLPKAECSCSSEILWMVGTHSLPSKDCVYWARTFPQCQGMVIPGLFSPRCTDARVPNKCLHHVCI